MWMRWNDTTHIFEQSFNDGASWAVLPLNASVINEGSINNARLPTSIAITGNLTAGGNITASGQLGQAGIVGNVPRLDTSNIFTQGDQRIIGNPFARVILSETSQPADARVFDIINLSQQLSIRALNDALSAVQAVPLGMNRVGDIVVGRYIYEKGRSNPLGVWQAAPADNTWFAIGGVAAGNWDPGTILAYAYTLIGGTMTLSVVVQGGTWHISSNQINLLIPAGKVCQRWNSGWGFATGGTMNYEVLWGYGQPGAAWLTIHRAGLANYPVATGNVYLYFQISLEVN